MLAACTCALIWSAGSSFISHCAAGMCSMMLTWPWTGAKHCIWISIFQTPFARSEKLYNPPWSETELSFLAPCLAVMVAPGSGAPLKSTRPRYSEAAARIEEERVARTIARIICTDFRLVIVLALPGFWPRDFVP
jgi:hypothetical protein